MHGARDTRGKDEIGYKNVLSEPEGKTAFGKHAQIAGYYKNILSTLDLRK